MHGTSLSKRDDFIRRCLLTIAITLITVGLLLPSKTDTMAEDSLFPVSANYQTPPITLPTLTVVPASAVGMNLATSMAIETPLAIH